MSSLNGFNGQQGRPGLRPAADQPQTNHANSGHPTAGRASGGVQPYPGQAYPAQAPQGQSPQQWQPQGGQYQQPSQQQWAPQPAQSPYAQQGYGQSFPSAADYGQPKTQPAFGGQPSYGGLSPNPDAYAPSFEPYSPVANPRAAAPAHQQNTASYAPQPAAADYGAQGGYGQSHYGQQPAHGGYGQPEHQWPGDTHPAHQSPAARGFEAASYQQQPVTGGHAAYRQADQLQHTEPSFSEWPQAQPQGSHGYDFGDANGYHHGQHQGGEHTDEMGFAQPAGGELEQGYADEEGEDYEYEEPVRGRRPLMIAAALAGAIFVGGGMAYGYKAFFGGPGSGNPPMVKSASEPSKIKPADAGGKQFAHTDSKIMGRLGEGAASGGAADSSGELDANGTRKVSTLVVGRDGSIQPPAVAPASAAPATDPSGNVNVPGMMIVDALGHGNKPAAPAPAAPVVADAPAPQKLVVTPPVAPQKPVKVAKAAVADANDAISDATGSIEDVPAAPVKPKPAVKKIAAAKPEAVNDAYTGSSAAPVTAPSGANGYVAVLASVPRSDSSRMTALKRFADMQQKYGSVLSGKTPDVAEANLGEKGAYHRLVVGPPASRQQASTLCSELKAQGYNDCWVTAY